MLGSNRCQQGTNSRRRLLFAQLRIQENELSMWENQLALIKLVFIKIPL